MSNIHFYCKARRKTILTLFCNDLTVLWPQFAENIGLVQRNKVKPDLNKTPRQDRGKLGALLLTTYTTPILKRQRAHQLKKYMYTSIKCSNSSHNARHLPAHEPATKAQTYTAKTVNCINLNKDKLSVKCNKMTA